MKFLWVVIFLCITAGSYCQYYTDVNGHHVRMDTSYYYNVHGEWDDPFKPVPDNNYEANADYYFASGDFKVAIIYLDSSIAAFPDHSYNFLVLGICYGMVGDYTSSIQSITQAISMSPGDKSGPWELGARKSRIDNDYFSSSESWSVQYNYYSAFFYRGQVKSRAFDYRGAIIDFDSCLAYSNGWQTYQLRGFCKIKLEKYKEAIVDLNKAISLNKEDGKSYHYRGICHYALGDTEKGCTDLSYAGQYGVSEAYKVIEEYCQ